MGEKTFRILDIKWKLFAKISSRSCHVVACSFFWISAQFGDSLSTGSWLRDGNQNKLNSSREEQSHRVTERATQFNSLIYYTNKLIQLLTSARLHCRRSLHTGNQGNHLYFCFRFSISMIYDLSTEIDINTKMQSICCFDGVLDQEFNDFQQWKLPFLCTNGDTSTPTWQYLESNLTLNSILKWLVTLSILDGMETRWNWDSSCAITHIRCDKFLNLNLDMRSDTACIRLKLTYTW